MKLTKKQIDIIIENTPADLKGKPEHLRVDFGYYMKSGASWSYRAGYVPYNGVMVLVARLHGVIA